MLKYILLIAVLIVVGLVVVVALQPSGYRIVRSATMAAPASAIFSEVNDFHRWEGWSPWAKLDPNAKNTFEGPPAGPGAIFTWTGNKQIGEGRMTLTDSRTNELVRIKLEFIRPFASICTTEFGFQPQGKQTAVTWSMTGENNFLGKAVCLFMNMDKKVGPDFDKGLAQIKAIVEKPAKP